MDKSKSVFSYKEIFVSSQCFDPGELIQIDVERNLDKMIGVDPDQVRNIVVVGAWRGNEVASFLMYPNATIYCFEPNKYNYSHLIDRWGGNERVICFEAACASFDGEAVLNEAHLTGNDSLLPIKEDSKTGLKLVKTHTIKTVRLDSVKELAQKPIDLLWADTQGYELEVLAGAPEMLTRTKSLFLEVCRQNMDYEKGVQYDVLIEFLDKKGFHAASEGLDDKGSGNAFFLENRIDNDAFKVEECEQRIKASLKGVSRKKYLLNFKIIRALAVFTPVKIKTFIRKYLFKLRSL